MNLTRYKCPDGEFHVFRHDAVSIDGLECIRCGFFNEGSDYGVGVRSTGEKQLKIEPCPHCGEKLYVFVDS